VFSCEWKFKVIHLQFNDCHYCFSFSLCLFLITMSFIYVSLFVYSLVLYLYFIIHSLSFSSPCLNVSFRFVSFYILYVSIVPCFYLCTVLSSLYVSIFVYSLCSYICMFLPVNGSFLIYFYLCMFFIL
jgi:hypothetical protein